MADLPVREKKDEASHVGKRRSRKSTIGETAKPKPKRPRGTATSESNDREQSADEGYGKLRATLYDAVAGRVGYEGLLLAKGGNPLPPDQVLYNRTDAPVRYAETDPYFAHRHLPPEQRLPESDMLKAVHAYASDLYGSMPLQDSRLDFRSLDETALIAIGILLEEAAAASLGETGDLAFVEGEEHEGGP